MKKALAFLLLAASVTAQPLWDGRIQVGVTNLPPGTVMADTGPVAADTTFFVGAKCSGTATGIYIVQRVRPDGNGGWVLVPNKQQLLIHLAGGHDDFQTIYSIFLGAGEKLQIVTLIPMTGTFSCSLWTY